MRDDHRVDIVLRAQRTSDLPHLLGGDSPFDDFGPVAIRGEPRPASLDADGGLSVVAEDGSLAGTVSWHWVRWGPNEASRCPMIGIWLRSECRGRGIGSTAQALLAELYFRHTAVNRLEAHTDVENLAEQRALEKAGFHREGVVRGAQWRDGAYRDGVLFSRLRRDVT